MPILVHLVERRHTFNDRLGANLEGSKASLTHAFQTSSDP